LYLKFFGLTEAPFAITPDPAFVYLSPEHRDALAHLLYGVGQGGSGGFVQLTGEVGTGKTTMCRCLLEQLPEDTHVALVLNPLLTPGELLATICEELGIDTATTADSNKAMVDALNRYLLQQHARGHRVVVVIDEAQNLSPDSLEQVRLLTNLETTKEKLLQMVLLGQPELRQLLQRSDLRQLAQRITARYHLKPLSREETRAYVRHRMMVAGAQRSPFTRSALRALYQRSDGVPRLINIIADRALAAAYARESGRVNARLVQVAANEVQPSEERVRSNPWPGVLATAAALALVAVSLVNWGAAWLDRNGGDDGMPAPVTDAGPAPEDRIPETDSANDVANDSGQPAADVEPENVSPATTARETDTADSLDASWVDVQHLGAWRSLAGLWGDPAGAAALQSACDGMPGLGYACLADSGSLSRIRHLGLPVLLVLRGGGYRLLPLRGFAGDKVIAGAPEDSRRISRTDLEALWLGEYLLAWPQAPDWPLEIRRGESGPAVDIVMQMAAYAEPAWQGGAMFDASFESWLMDFQRRNGLDADGIIGPNTLIHLMAPTLGKPRLVMNSEEDG
jgi:general secretion pathway protein A